MSTDTTPPPGIIQLQGRIHDIAPLLEHAEFTRDETPYDTAGETPAGHGIILRLCQVGALDRERIHDGGNTYCRYRWRESAREYFRDYREEMDTLPCECRIHVPDTRDDPDGIISCKYCGREYPAAFFEQLVADHL